MRIPATLMLAAGLLATAAPAVAATVVPPGTHLVPGFYDPKTGTFKPVLKPSGIGSNPNLSNIGGKFVVNFTITVASAIPTTTPIYCEVDAGTADDETGNYIDETATVLASRHTATSATCTVTIPYAWYHLATPTLDAVQLSYILTAGTINLTSQTVDLTRTSGQNITTLKAIPANGVTTTEAVTATI